MYVKWLRTRINDAQCITLPNKWYLYLFLWRMSLRNILYSLPIFVIPRIHFLSLLFYLKKKAHIRDLKNCNLPMCHQHILCLSEQKHFNNTQNAIILQCVISCLMQVCVCVGDLNILVTFDFLPSQCICL